MCTLGRGHDGGDAGETVQVDLHPRGHRDRCERVPRADRLDRESGGGGLLYQARDLLRVRGVRDGLWFGVGAIRPVPPCSTGHIHSMDWTVVQGNSGQRVRS
ncbi:hypothetical protein GCM10023353_16790 [Tomitella cavernea]|uniref:Uncharacterized protein n=1 Tax=Tomitella cavernea TaxID=1387982 RepID=A0ABP9CK93_9ACTN